MPSLFDIINELKNNNDIAQIDTIKEFLYNSLNKISSIRNGRNVIFYASIAKIICNSLGNKWIKNISTELYCNIK